MPDSEESKRLSHLDRLIAARHNNIQVSRQRLGDTCSLAEDVAQAYDALNRLMHETSDPPAHFPIIGGLQLAAQHEFSRAILDVLACQLTDAMGPTRRAVELAGFAGLIARDSSLAQTWMLATDREDAYGLYRSAFKTGRVFPKEGEELLQRLYRRYDRCSKQLHGSIYSVASRMTISQSARELSVEWQSFECSEADRSEPATSFLYVIDTHMGILELFAGLYREQLGPRWPAWEVRFHPLQAKVHAHIERWRPLIQAARLARGEPETDEDDPNPDPPASS